MIVVCSRCGRNFVVAVPELVCADCAAAARAETRRIVEAHEPGEDPLTRVFDREEGGRAVTPLGPVRISAFVAGGEYVLDLLPSADRVDGGFETYFLGRGGAPGQTMGRFFVAQGPTIDVAAAATYGALHKGLVAGAAVARPVRSAA